MKKLITRKDARWKNRFRAPAMLWSELAPLNAERGIVLTNKTGQYNLHAWTVSTGELRQLTFESTGIRFGTISPNGEHVYYLQDDGGNEIGHFARVPFEGGEPDDITPDLAAYTQAGIHISRNGKTMAAGTSSAKGFRIFILRNDAPTSPKLLYQSERATGWPRVSTDGSLAVLHTAEKSTGPRFSLRAVDASGGHLLNELFDGPDSHIEAVDFSPASQDTRVLASSDRTGFTRPLIWDPVSDQRQDIRLKNLEGDVVPIDWSPDGALILLMHFLRAEQRLLTYNIQSTSLRRLVHPAGSFGLAGGVFGRPAYFTPQGNILAHLQHSTQPLHVVELDGKTGVEVRTHLSAGEVPRSRKWRGVGFNSLDGTQLQAWLATPSGHENAPFPTVIHIHGGPEAVMTETFLPSSQAWLDHGLAFLTINYRGSTTFGRKFREQIWGRPGHFEALDIVAARKWLVDSGIADPDSVFLTGWSYGGFLTLLTLGKYPDLWAGGMAGVAIADWIMSYEDSNELLRAYQTDFFGGTPADKREVYIESSPITYAESIQAPILIIQGRNDTRTPARPIEVFERKMIELRKEIEVNWFDAGHLGAGVEKDIDHHEYMLRFAGRVLSNVRGRTRMAPNNSLERTGDAAV